MCWHKWSKWEQFENKRFLTKQDGLKIVVDIQRKQKRKCLKCNKEQTETIYSS